QLQLAGEPRNGLLQLPDQLLAYLLAVLQGRPTAVPEAPEDDWKQLTYQLSFHGLNPLLFWNISHDQEIAPPPADIHEAIRREFMVSCVSTATMEAQLSQLVSAFQTNRIPLLVLKGPALGWRYYPDPAVRTSGDIDLLMLPDDIGTGRALLESLGYRCLANRYDLAQDFFCHEIFLHTDKQNRAYPVELHWDLHSFSAAARKKLVGGLRERAVTVETATVRFSALHPVDALVHAALHLTLQHTRDIKLIWLYDIALLCKEITASDGWDTLVERCRQWHAVLAVQRSLVLARAWFGSAVPDHAINEKNWPQPAPQETKLWHAAAMDRKG
ncbi:MAG: nucleotidyltransferase family protein, partial [Delftia sp.]|nr:nucleotidyltransferase family protein [Delftia sp.]